MYISGIHVTCVRVCIVYMWLMYDVGIVHDMTHDMNYMLYKNGYHFFCVHIVCSGREVKRINIKKRSSFFIRVFDIVLYTV